MKNPGDVARDTRGDTARPKTGIVHLGLGAFFRAHGAIYISEAMQASGGDWGVVGVNLRSPGIRDKLRPQDWAYTATRFDDQGTRTEIVDVLNTILVAPEDPEAVLNAMAEQDTKIVSLTVTEKGYCHTAGTGRLDDQHPDILHDISHDMPRSAPGYIVRALQRRKQLGLAPLTVMSLDNLPSNGVVTRRVILDLADAIDPELKDWIEAHGAFPSTMVDRIVPATTDALITDVQNRTGLQDAAPVGHEPFRQWVIEDTFVGGARPDFIGQDVLFVKDVTPFEHMKLRMLNGAHSALAYLGSLAGFRTVAEAIADPVVAAFIRTLWEDEVIPSLDSPDGISLTDYANSLQRRFANRGIEHLLLQIAMDGSQKMPQRILAPLFDNVQSGRPHAALLLVLAGWIRFLGGTDDDGRALTISDPHFDALSARLAGTSNAAERAAAICGYEPVFGSHPIHLIEPDLARILDMLESSGTSETLKAVLT